MKYVINGECTITDEVLTEVVEDNNYDDAIAQYKVAHPTTTCLNADVLTEGTAKEYGVPWDMATQ